MKKWRWVLSFFICITVYIFYFTGPTYVQQFIKNLVYTSNDIVWLRQAYNSILSDPEEIILVDYQDSISVTSLEPLENGFVVQSNVLEIRAREKGIIIYTGTSKDLGKQITVFYDHSNVTVTYAFLREIKQLPYVTISEQDLLGTLGRDQTFYIKIEQGNQTFDEEETRVWLNVND